MMKEIDRHYAIAFISRTIADADVTRRADGRCSPHDDHSAEYHAPVDMPKF